MFPPHTTMPTRRPRSRLAQAETSARRERRRRPARRQASPPGTAGACRRESGSSFTSTTSSTNCRLSAKEYGSQRGAPSESAIVRTASIDCGDPASKLRLHACPRLPAPRRRQPCAGLICFTAQATPPVSPPPPAATSTASSAASGRRDLVDELHADRCGSECRLRSLVRMDEGPTFAGLDLLARARTPRARRRPVRRLRRARGTPARGTRSRSSASRPSPSCPSGAPSSRARSRGSRPRRR